MSDRFYTLTAIPKIIEVVCPKHRRYMTPLSNGFLGNEVYWCESCDYPYALKPVKMREFNRKAVDAQLAMIKHNGR